VSTRECPAQNEFDFAQSKIAWFTWSGFSMTAAWAAPSIDFSVAPEIAC
jgi:hypothetical protein